MSRREDARRGCRKCELPKVICACAEAAAYDRAYPFRPLSPLQNKADQP